MEIGHTIKSIFTGMPVILTGGVPATRAGDDRLTSAHFNAPATLTVSSSAFEPGAMMPTRYSADGENSSPPLEWTGVSDAARSLVLIVEDPDAPTPNPFVHWLAYGISTQSSHLFDAITKERTDIASGLMQGKNSGLKIGWTGMAPPKGDTPHRYFFQLYALDTELDLQPGAGRSTLIEAMEGHVIAQGRLIGLFQRS